MQSSFLISFSHLLAQAVPSDAAPPAPVAGYGTMVARIACSLKINDIKAFSRLLQNILNNDVSSGSFSLVLTPELEQGVLKSWESMTDFTNFEALLKNKLAQSSPLDASALIDFFNLVYV